jgi:type II secretory ATPase GspE/PulE/Tfp pilus assembly ATPase PilB-like protein
MKAVPRSETNEVRHAVSLMIRIGVAMRVTDISLAPYVKTEGGPPVAVLSFRVDGVVNRLAEFDVRLLQPLLDYWKSMAGCNIQERLRPQDGRILLKLADTQRNLDLRVCFLPAVLGESLTARVLDASAVRLDLEAMGYTPRDKQMLLRSLRAAWGVIFVTGPTGCGKTTLLYSCLKYLAAPEIKLITVEEPVEFFIPHVIQTQLRPSVGVTFAAALRAVLRSDPDVVLVGEIRDLETLQVVHQTASTGHLVLTTLHTEDAPSALTRMIDIGSDPFLVGDSVKLIIAQRLIRNLCPHCSVERTPPPPSLHEAGKMARSGGLDWNSLPKRFREPVGCAKCNKFGYRGRDVIAEALEVTPEIAAALRRLAKTEELRAIAVTQGMTTIAADGIRRAAAGHTTIAEVFRAVGVR